MVGQQAEFLDPEQVAYWYFRLNGFFQMDSFIVHPPGKGSQRTDADLLGIRFPYRQEMYFDDPDRTMGDDTNALQLSNQLTDVAIIEVKTSQPCSLNGPWSDQDQHNVHRVLAAIGCFPMDQINEAAVSLYGTGKYSPEGQNIRVRLIAVGNEASEDLAKNFPNVVQVTWNQVLTFIGNRLHEFRSNKRDVSQWDGQIRLLQALVLESSSRGEMDIDQFVGIASHSMGLKNN